MSVFFILAINLVLRFAGQRGWTDAGVVRNLGRRAGCLLMVDGPIRGVLKKRGLPLDVEVLLATTRT